MPLLPFFKKQAPPEPTILSMTGVRLGQHVLAVAERDRSIVQHLGAKAGLSGRLLAFGADAAGAATLEAHVQAQGVLIDSAVLALPLPADADAFDIAVVDDRHTRSVDGRALLTDIYRVLRPGGRVIVLRPAGGRLLQGLFGRQPTPPDVGPVLETLTTAGFHNPRLLGVRDGMAFIEGTVRAGT